MLFMFAFLDKITENCHSSLSGVPFPYNAKPEILNFFLINIRNAQYRSFSIRTGENEA